MASQNPGRHGQLRRRPVPSSRPPVRHRLQRAEPEGPMGRRGVTISVPLGRHGLLTGAAPAPGRPILRGRGAGLDDGRPPDLATARTWKGRRPAARPNCGGTARSLDGRVKAAERRRRPRPCQVEAAQSLVLFDGQLFVADRVDEAFAVVQVGRNAGVEVFRENQSVGRTDAGGRLFVNHLRAYESNGLSVDPRACRWTPPWRPRPRPSRPSRGRRPGRPSAWSRSARRW